MKPDIRAAQVFALVLSAGIVLVPTFAVAGDVQISIRGVQKEAASIRVAAYHSAE